MKLSKSLFSGHWGVEREVLRIDEDGWLSTRPHPFPPDERKITVDFAEAQAELITGVHDSPEAALDELSELQQQLLDAAPDELLWPFSLPGRWAGELSVDIARFAGDPRFEEQRRYREGLARTYGKARQILSGIHVNYSFGSEHPGGDYFGVIRNFIRYKPLLTFLLASSPWLSSGIEVDLSRQRPEHPGEQSRACRDHTTSVRLGPLGYGLDPEVEAKIDVRFDSLEEYLFKLERALQSDDEGRPPLLRHEREFYAAVRPKPLLPGEKGRTLELLRRQGVGYLEFRIFDLDPFAPLGIAEETLLFFELFVLACSILPSPLLTPRERGDLARLERGLTLCGQARGIHLLPPFQEIIDEMLPELESLANLGGPKHRMALASFRRQLRGEAQRRIDRLRTAWADETTSPLGWGLERARLHRAWASLDHATRRRIREADERGVRVSFIDGREKRVSFGSESEISHAFSPSLRDEAVSQEDPR